ncbi:MAG: cyclic lactone autoinducer peptide [Butyrivibrio sp.]|nr:cyclic lactone autoinducer peptide [Butyrivibrio sp.]
MKGEKKILAKGLEKLSRAAVKVNSENRCMMYGHQPLAPKGLKSFLSAK